MTTTSEGAERADEMPTCPECAGQLGTHAVWCTKDQRAADCGHARVGSCPKCTISPDGVAPSEADDVMTDDILLYSHPYFARCVPVEGATPMLPNDWAEMLTDVANAYDKAALPPALVDAGDETYSGRDVRALANALASGDVVIVPRAALSAPSAAPERGDDTRGIVLTAADLGWLRSLAGNHTVDLNRLPKWAASLRDRALAAGVEAMKSAPAPYAFVDALAEDDAEIAERDRRASAAPEARSGDTDWMGDAEELTAFIWRAMQDGMNSESITIDSARERAVRFLAHQSSASLPPSATERITTPTEKANARHARFAASQQESRMSAPERGAETEASHD